MRASGGKLLGIIGLLWFVYFAGSAIYCLIVPDTLRKSDPPWTDREIKIGALCYIAVGFAGGIFAFRRLVLPLFRKNPPFTTDDATLGDSVHVVPALQDCIAFYRQHWWRANVRARIIAAILVLVVSIPSVALRAGAARGIALLTTAGLLLFVVFVPLRWKEKSERYACESWERSPRLREPRTYQFFDSGFTVTGETLSASVPWESVKRAESIDHVIALSASNGLFIIPNSALTPDARQRLIALMREKVKKSHAL